MKTNHLKAVEGYCKQITKGDMCSGRYARKAVERFLQDLKRQKNPEFPYEFKPALAEEVIDFAESLYIPDIGKSLELLPWMKFIYYNLYGWVEKLDNEKRRFISGYIEVARKNSKTTSLLFPMILTDFFTTPSAEAYFVLHDGAQAEKSFRELRSIVNANPAVKEGVEETKSTMTFGSSRIAFFSSESGGIDSYKNSCSVVDEFHAYEHDRVITSFRYGGRARKNSLVLIITSAGLTIAGPCYAENEKARKVLNGVLTDETYFTIIYAYDEEDNWQDPRLFLKANPSLGVILQQDVLEKDLTDALLTPSHQSDFKAKTCGIWSHDISSWIPLSRWDTALRNKPFEVLGPVVGYGALDLSSINDFTAYTRCFYADGLYWFLHRFYVPLEQVQEKYVHENINIRTWIDQGIVRAIPGPTIDYEFIYQDIAMDIQEYPLAEIAYDPWMSDKLINALADKFPSITLIEVNQNLSTLSNPTKEYERLIMEDRIVDPNPVMKWMVGNAVIRPDANNNYKPLKGYKSSTNRIDGVITSIMSLNRCMAQESGRGGSNFDDVLALFTLFS
jgi:phage terminase large subunit-like protein